MTSAGDGAVVRLEQRYDGVEVFGAEIAVRVDNSSRVMSVAGKLMPGIDLSTDAGTAPTVAESRAVTATASEFAIAPSAVDVAAPTLAVYDPSWVDPAAAGGARLTWKVEADGTGTDPEALQLVFVDANNGTVVDSVHLAASALDRRVCNDDNLYVNSGSCPVPTRVEGDGPSSDDQVDDIYDQLGAVYDYYADRYGRDSVDDAGLQLVGVARGCLVVDDCPMFGAYWDPNNLSMVFGDGWAVDDVTGHELTHGVIQFTSGLVSENEPGAISEALADIFGEFIDQTNGIGDDGDGDGDDERWLIAEEAPGGALRDMEDPTAIEQPDRYRSPLWYTGTEDSGGVHINSGVANKAAYLMTDGDSFNGYTIDGIGEEKVGHVFYEANTALLTSTSNYRDLYNALMQACANTTAEGITTADDCKQVKAAADATQMNRGHTTEGTALAHRPECEKHTLGRNDDGSTGQVNLPFPINFFGNVHNSLYVNNNGNVTFNGPMGTYTPFALTAAIGTPVIAPFFADIDTRGLGSAEVTYGATDDGKTFCVDWAGHGVGYYYRNVDKLVRVRLVIEDHADEGDPGDFDIVFDYDTAQWETGDASGGSGGFGGEPVRVGFSAGTGEPGTFFEFTGSGVSHALTDGGPNALVAHNRNSPQHGRYRFEVRSGNVPVGSSIRGTVYEGSVDDGNELRNAFVQACPVSGSQGCGTSTTDSDGDYEISGLPAGQYHVSAYPPSSSDAQPRTITVTLAPLSDTERDIVLDETSEVPGGTTITNYRIRNGIPSVPALGAVVLTTHGCPGATASFRIEQHGDFLTSNVMTEDPSGTYTGSVPELYPNYGPAHVEIKLECPNGQDEVIGFDIYIDPSGLVVDIDDNPIAGATVTLLRSDSVSGPFEIVPDGSGLMSPANRTNPDLTTAEGRFGWDVVAGYYKVQAAKTGCDAPGSDDTPFVETGVLTIPPPVTDLELVLECAPVEQTVEFTTAPPASAVSGSTFPVAATASSGLEVTITTTGACTGSGVSPITVTTAGTGTCTVDAARAGGSGYLPAATSASVDVIPAFRVSVGDIVAVEPDSGTLSALVPIVLSQPGSSTVTVKYKIEPISATAAVDFNNLKGKEKSVTLKVVKATGLTPRTTLVKVSIKGDTAIEPDESFRVRITSVTGGPAVTDDTGVVTIVNDDAASGTAVYVSDQVVLEPSKGKGTTVKTRVTLSQKATSTVSVQVNVGGSATADADYSGVSPATVTFKKGQDIAYVSLKVLPDTAAEGVESVTFTLANPTGGLTIARPVGTLQIFDDD